VSLSPDDAATYGQALAKIVVGDVQQVSGPIEIVDYDPAWPAQYVRQAHRIRRVLAARWYAWSMPVPHRSPDCRPSRSST
jgi:hypothetical protein